MLYCHFHTIRITKITINYVIFPYLNSSAQKWSPYQYLCFSGFYAYALPYYEMTKCNHLLIINEEWVNFKN